MPNSLVHLKIGNNIVKKYNKFGNPDFYLGLITPDAVNLYGFAEKKLRWGAHIRAKNLDVWEKQILDFYELNKNKYEEAYLLGYLIHVLTDIVFDRIYGKKLLDLIHSNEIYEDEFGFYHQELKKYEASQIEEDWWKNIIDNIRKANAISINFIDSNEISMWRDKIIEEYNKMEKEDQGMIKEDLIEEATSNVEEILIKNKII